MFKTANEFSLYIEERVVKERIGYMDAIINYCNTIDIDVGSIASLVNQSLKDKIQLEAEDLNFLKKSKTVKLPI